MSTDHAYHKAIFESIQFIHLLVAYRYSQQVFHLKCVTFEKNIVVHLYNQNASRVSTEKIKNKLEGSGIRGGLIGMS